MRLDRWISQTTPLSRNDAKQALRAKRVQVNDVICTDGSVHIQAHDSVQLDGQHLNAATDIYLALHKPAGFCCSHDDDGYPSALQLLPASLTQIQKLHFAGRLDADTTGLVLLSSDGAWCHRVTSPKQARNKQKSYHVELAYDIDDTALQTLAAGILLHGENKPTLPCQIQRSASNRCTIQLSEGRYHQVKRMFAAVGNKVLHLHRQQIADICLDANLPSGSYRQLSSTEIAQF